MQQHDIHEVDEFRGNLSYEQILARAIDRCLYFRVVDPYGSFYESVIALGLSLVDMTGKRIRSDYDLFISDKQYDFLLSGDYIKEKGSHLKDFDAILREITKILQKHKMLFRSQLIETNV